MLTLTIRPVSAFCNARCKYCYHEDMVTIRRTVMSDKILELMVRKYQTPDRRQCRYVWHGGEPTIAGLPYYEKAMKLQSQYRTPGQLIRNSMQSNGWLVDDRWISFFNEHEFDLGISLDGPNPINDLQRGDGYFDKTMKTVKRFQDAGIPFSVICVVTSQSVAYPDEIFDFFIEHGMKQLSFNPVFGEHPGYDLDQHAFADFLTRIYDRWSDLDDPEVEVRFLRETALTMLGGQTNLCMMQGGCQNHLIVEHDGSILPCHSYADDLTAVGHLATDEFEQVGKHEYFRPVQLLVDENCNSCRWYSLCGGDCVRFIDPEAEHVKSSYCAGRKTIFAHIERDLLESGFLESEFHGEGTRMRQMLGESTLPALVQLEKYGATSEK